MISSIYIIFFSLNVFVRCCYRPRNSFLILIRKICRSRGQLASLERFVCWIKIFGSCEPATGNSGPWIGGFRGRGCSLRHTKTDHLFFPLLSSLGFTRTCPARMDGILIALLPACGSASLSFFFFFLSFLISFWIRYIDTLLETASASNKMHQRRILLGRFLLSSRVDN